MVGRNESAETRRSRRMRDCGFSGCRDARIHCTSLGAPIINSFELSAISSLFSASPRFALRNLRDPKPIGPSKSVFRRQATSPARNAQSFEAVFLQFAEERAAGNSERAGRFGFVAAGADQSFADSFAFQQIEFVRQALQAGEI